MPNNEPTIEQILNLSAQEIADLDTKTIIKYTNRLNSMANKRVRRAVKGKYYKQSPAIMNAIKYHGKNKQNPFSTTSIKKTKGKAYKKSSAMRAFGDVKSFLQLKTSTKKGVEQMKKEINVRLGGSFKTKKVANRFWQVYHKFLETSAGKSLVSKGNSAEVQNYLFKIFSGGAIFDNKNQGKLKAHINIPEDMEEEIFEKLEAFARGAYEEEQEEEDNEEDYSDFF